MSLPPSMFRVRAASLEDARRLSLTLRQADRVEIDAATTETPLQVLCRGVETSQPCYAVDLQSHPVALFGVVPETGNRGLVWMLAAEELARAGVSVFRQGVVWLDRLQERYPVLHNWVDAGNSVHLQWCLWCGFKIVGVDERHGVKARRFLEVHRSRAPGPGLQESHPVEGWIHSSDPLC